MEMYRQGGLLLIPVDQAPPGVEASREADGALVLVTQGGVPHHTLLGEGATLVCDEWYEWYLTVTNPQGVDLVREGRATIRVRPGCYRLGLQHGFRYWEAD